MTRKLGVPSQAMALQMPSRSSEQPAPSAAASVRALAPGLAPKVMGSSATTRAKAGDCLAMPSPDFHQRSFARDLGKLDPVQMGFRVENLAGGRFLRGSTAKRERDANWISSQKKAPLVRGASLLMGRDN
jgi:hypothetical protein